MLHQFGEWRTPQLKAHLLHKTQTKLSHPQQDQSKRQCPEFLFHFKVLSSRFLGSCEAVIQVAYLVHSCCSASGSLLEAVWGTSMATQLLGPQSHMLLDVGTHW